jgi:homocysteine S-methyltransferase
MTRDAPVVLLDGGLSTALEQQGHDLSDPLWTARVLLDDPAAVAAAHHAYFAAGAQVATTASYQASVPSLMQRGLDRREAEQVLRRSVTLAREVRDALAADGSRRLVAASVGPYGALLADGSEYRGRYGLTARQLRDVHAPRLELLAEAAPDLLAVETIPDVDEAEVIAALLDDIGLRAWFSFSVSGGRTRAGQPLAEAFTVAGAPDAVVAVGVNCCRPADALEAVRLATAVTGKPAVVYPNGGEQWDADARAWVGPGVFDARQAAQWVEAGAVYLGGCCRVGPSAIAQLAQVLDPAREPRQRTRRQDEPPGG